MPLQRKASTILVVDARELRRAAMMGLLSAWADANSIELIAVAPDDAVEATEANANCRMVVFIVGSQSIRARENMQWIKVMRAIAPSAPIVVISDAEDGAEVVSSLGAGVQGFLPTSMGRELALQAFSFVLAGGSFFPPAAIRNIPTAESQEPPSGSRLRKTEQPSSGGSQAAPPSDDDTDAQGSSLTQRQQEVLQLLQEGQPNKVIARQLGMTEATVKVHVRHIMRKLGASNRTQAALCGMSNVPLVDIQGVQKSTEERFELPRLWAAE